MYLRALIELRAKIDLRVRIHISHHLTHKKCNKKNDQLILCYLRNTQYFRGAFCCMYINVRKRSLRSRQDASCKQSAC